MRRVLAVALLLLTLPLAADPLSDQNQWRQYYQSRFPQLQLQDYAHGVYAIDEIARSSWQAIEEFPPYQPAIDHGEVLFNTAFKNGKRYADCFDNQGLGIAQTYPRWDSRKGKVLTLAQAINDCRVANHEAPLNLLKGEITELLAYLVFTSRGKAIDVVVPDNDSRALAAYQQGKDFYYQRRGQLNFACATCHVQNVGKKLRTEILSPALGHTNGWPTYRLKWGEMGTLPRRFLECLEQIKAADEPLPPQALTNLEYFLTVMGNGIAITGPSTRK
ncbi:sulfur oxidation c-type cytochrome SoxA [Methylosoma difficile]